MPSVLSLVIILVIWVALFKTALRWCRSVGVTETPDAFALAYVVPTAALLVAVHIPAMYCLFFGAAIVTLPVVAMVFMLLACMTWRLDKSRHEVLPTAGTARENRTLNISHVAWPVLLIAAVYAVFMADALTRFPTGCDGLHYHLPVAVQWTQTHRLDLIWGLKHQSFPENGMIVPFLLLGAGAERLVNIAQLPSAAIVALCVFGLARAIGTSSRGAVLTACIALSVPIVMFQAFSTYIDLYAAAAWLSALLALVWAHRAPNERAYRALVIIAGLSAGIALGSKTTYLVLVPLLALVVTGATWLRIRRVPNRVTRMGRTFGVFCAASLACSVFWFARGTVQAGNPVYPLAVEVAGQQILPGFTADQSPHFPRRSMSEKVSRWWNYPWREAKPSGTGYPYGVNNGLGAAYATFVPIGVIFAIISLRKRYPRGAAGGWTLVFGALVLVGGVIHLTLFREMLRFVFPLLILAVALSGRAIDVLHRARPRMTTLFVTTAIGLTACIACFKPAHALAGRFKDATWDRHAFYGTPPLIDDLPAGTRILNLSSAYATYPLFGTHRKCVVLTPLHWVMLTGGESVTHDSLIEHNIDYVYVREAWRTSWPDKLPIELVFDTADPSAGLFGPSRHFYRVVRHDTRAGNDDARNQRRTTGEAAPTGALTRKGFASG